MTTIKKFLAAIAAHLPAYLRPDRSAEGTEQQKAAASTTHG